MSLISFDNTDYTTSSTTTTVPPPPSPKAMKLICKCKRNLEFDDDVNGGENGVDHNHTENPNKIQCLEENCVTRNEVSNGDCDDWHPLNGTRYIELWGECLRSTNKCSILASIRWTNDICFYFTCNWALQSLYILNDWNFSCSTNFRYPDGTVKLRNPNIELMDQDILYHLALGSGSHDLVEMFGDVKVYYIIFLVADSSTHRIDCVRIN